MQLPHILWRMTWMTFGALLSLVLLWAAIEFGKIMLGMFVFVLEAVAEKLKRS